MVVRILAALFGCLLIVVAFKSAVRTFILPRAAPDRLARSVFVFTRYFFRFLTNLRKQTSYLQRDALMAYFAPISLLSLLLVWIVMFIFGFGTIYWATGIDSLQTAIVLSGSSLATLGIERGTTLLHDVLSIGQGVLGMLIVALLIGYLPTMYGAFSERERAVSLLEVRAGTPPSAVEMILRFNRIGRLEELNAHWTEWEQWFASVNESHTSLAALVFFRSPKPEQSWITAAGSVLDAAALAQSTIDLPQTPEASLCIRAGFLALRSIGDYFQAPYDSDPSFPETPISIKREEFEQACDLMAEHGIPIKQDRDQAWLDFGGWRVNYDQPLLALCAITMAPEAEWSSDRAPAFKLPTLGQMWRGEIAPRLE